VILWAGLITVTIFTVANWIATARLSAVIRELQRNPVIYEWKEHDDAGNPVDDGSAR